MDFSIRDPPYYAESFVLIPRFAVNDAFRVREAMQDLRPFVSLHPLLELRALTFR